MDKAANGSGPRPKHLKKPWVAMLRYGLVCRLMELQVQTYGATGKRLSNKALTADIKYALKGGAVGITFFRFGLFNQVNMNKITV